MKVYGWGRFPVVAAESFAPVDTATLQEIIADKQNRAIICRGAGRSYGDSSLAETIVSSRFLDSFAEFNSAEAIIDCGAGVILGDILKLAIPKGLFLSVLPGTKTVSVGGAIAADIHGKNHHIDGCFSNFVISFNLLLASGEVVQCSHTENTELFQATCGGMGLTGVILSARIQLKEISSVTINQRSIVASDLDNCLDILDEHNESKYSVAWIDCLAGKQSLGRSIVYLGEHGDDDNLQVKTRRGPSVPFSTPSFLLNKYTMKAFNSSYFAMRGKNVDSRAVTYDSYFFPLDNIRNWNRLYGAKGFLQYQLVIPTEFGKAGLREVLSEVNSAGKGSFLAVLKRFGCANENLLSFPIEGYTLALDFKYDQNLMPLLGKLDKIVLANNGRIYLAKDALMDATTFKASYPKWEAFCELKKKVDPDNRFRSLQSNRLGITAETAQ
jgi:decaprenylphospho-beta-D-ribofuranose 2-oxidase